ISWANVRAKRDMQILCTSGPNTGSFSFQRSASCLPRVERRKVRIPKISEPIPTTRKYHSLRTKSETSIRNWVGAGSLAPKSLKQRNAGIDHGRELAGKEDKVRFFDRPDFFAGFTGDGFLLERQNHQTAAH